MLVFIIFAVVFLASILLNRAYWALPKAELRRRARSGHDKAAAAIYKASSYGESLEVLLWLFGSLGASFLILTAANTGWWLATLLILVAGFFVFAGRLATHTDGWLWRAAAWSAIPAAKLLSYLQPVFGRAGGLLKSWRPAHPHTHLYEKEDLLDMLKAQNHQADSRFSDVELAIVGGALTFGDKTVSHIMTPRSKLKMVTANEAIGPMLMDELHKTHQKRFPVVKELSKSAEPQVLGSLFIGDLLNRLDEKGTVSDIMHPGPAYVNEDQDLRQALEVFLKSHQHMLVVVNNFEEVSGVLSIEDVFEQILGEKLNNEYDRVEETADEGESPAEDKNHNAADVAPKEK